MFGMASTIGICAIIIWIQAVKLIHKDKELKYYKNKSDMLERVVKYDYSSIRGHNNDTESAVKDNSRQVD